MTLVDEHVGIISYQTSLSENLGESFYQKEALERIYAKKDHTRRNFLYFDWHSGAYVFEDLLEARYKHINLIKFSLFDIFNQSYRWALVHSFNNDKERYISIIAEMILRLQPDGLLVTHDWLPFHVEIINIFKEYKIPVILILHEGVFQNVDKYYSATIPISDKALVWGELHKNIFIERGYPEEKIRVVGSIKLNKYKLFKPFLSRDDFFKTCGLDKDRKTIIYCCQLCDGQWGDQEYALSHQRGIIDDVIKIACRHNYNIIIRNTLASPNLVLPQSFLKTYETCKNVFIDGEDVDSIEKSIYKVNAEDSLYHCDLVIGLNTTMQLEASLLNKPAIVARYFDFDPKWQREIGLPTAENYTELEGSIVEYINCKHSLISPGKISEFCKNYGYSDDMEYSPLKNVEKELLDLDIVTDTGRTKNFYEIDNELILPEYEADVKVPFEKISMIEIEIFSFCNRKCWFCPNSFIDRKSQNILMDENVYINVLNDLKSINYSGMIAYSRYNEPLSNKDIFLKRLAQAKELVPNALLHTNTNGDYLTREYLDELYEVGLRSLNIQCYLSEQSVLDVEDIKDRISKMAVKLDLEKSMRVTAFRSDWYEVSFHYKDMSIRMYARDFNVNGNNRGGTLKDMPASACRHNSCSVPFTDIYIDYNGNVMPCCNLRSDISEHKKFILGNVHNERVLEIFNGQPMQKLRRVLQKNIIKLYPCNECKFFK